MRPRALRGRAPPALKITRQGSEGGGRGLSGVIARAKDFWRGYSQPGIQLIELRPSWLSSLHIMRISDAEALTERLSCCAAS